jgi:small subunit ribosomal protein S8
MTMTDPIADLLTRIRNAITAKREEVILPASKMKLEVAKILKNEGYIRNFKFVEDAKQGILKIHLKYDDSGKPIVRVLKRVSKPSRRVYCAKDEIPQVLGGLGITILSTSKGIMTGQKAAHLGLGGEVLCSIC